jgi:hypothetical protein
MKIIWNESKKCCTWEDGSLIKPIANGCRGHSTGHGLNKVKCSSLACTPIDCDHKYGHEFGADKWTKHCPESQRRLNKWHKYLQKEITQ